MTSESTTELTEEQTNRALSKMIKQGIAAQIRITLTEGVFLVGFALLLGAPNTVIGLLAAVPSIIQLLQIPAVMLVERIGERRRVNFITQLGNRLGVLFMVMIPFLGTFEGSYILLIVAVGIQAVFNAVGSPSWNSWLRDLVPDERLGEFFSRRMAITGIAAIIVSILGGYFIEQWNVFNIGVLGFGYAVLFFVAFLFGMIAIYYTKTTPEPKLLRSSVKTGFIDLIKQPFEDKNFMNLIRFSVIWTLSTSISASFFTVYLLQRLGLSFFLATLLASLTQLISILFFRLWGRLSDRFSNKSILQVAVPLFMISTFLWTFTGIAEIYSFLIPLLVLIHLLSGFSAAGVNLTSSNIGLKLAPRKRATSYLAARGALIAIAGTIGPILGGLLADLLSGHTLEFALTWTGPGGEILLFLPTYRISGLDFVFLLSVVIGLYGLHRLAYIIESGEVDETIVIDAIIAETRRNVKTFTTIDGLRQTFQIPLSDLRKRARRRKSRSTKSKTYDEEESTLRKTE